MLKPMDCKNMDDIRYAIDIIDEDIVNLIAKRSKYVQKASSFKKDAIAVQDKERVKKVIASKKELAKKYGVSSSLIETIYTNMIEHFIKEEMKEWKQ
jgi:isochorismate pyruvate lyase